MTRTNLIICALCGVILSLSVSPIQATIVTGQIDDFEDGTVEAWHTSVINPNPATNIPSGGPAGANDHYMRLSSNGSAGAGGKLVAFNGDQWGGDYLAAGVTSIRMMVNNLGATDLVLRLILEDSIDGMSLTTLAPVAVPAGSGWSQVAFSLNAANLTGDIFQTVMSNVVELNLVHSPNVIASRSLSPNVVAQLGIDQITALPIPFPGDTNGDQVVDFDDLNTLLSSYGLPGDFAHGDFDHSGLVDFDDLNVLLTNYGLHAPLSAAATAVPEPATIWLAAVCAMIVVPTALRRRLSKHS